MKLVLDASILIDKLRGGHRWDAFLDNVDKTAELFVPSIVAFELYAGNSTKEAKNAKIVANILSFFQLVDLTLEIGIQAGEIYRDITKTLQIPDYLIAVTAISLGGYIVTLNQKHFKQIPGVRIYHYA